MGSRDLLFLCHRIPFPPDKGDKIRSWNLLKHLTQNWRVHLGCFVDDPADRQHQDYLAGLTASSCFVPLDPRLSKLKSVSGLITGEALSFAFYRSAKMKAFIGRVQDQHAPAIQFGFSSAMAQFLVPESANIPTVIDFCDCDAEKWRAYGQSKRGAMGLIYRREATRVAASENEIVNRVGASFAITPAEADLFNRRPETRATVKHWANGVDTEYFDPDVDVEKLNGQAPDIVFVGAMDYLPNAEAALWFAKMVWPRIHVAIPQARFAIVGSKPTLGVKALHGRQNIEVTGRVNDVRPWLGRAKIVVAPLQIARGIQNKVLEAMAMAKPVVATHAAAEGIDATHQEHFILCDDPQQMSEEVINLLGDEQRRNQLGSTARNLAVSHYGWAAQLAIIDRSLAQLTANYD